MFSRFDTTPVCDRQTDGRTDRQTDIHLATASSCYGFTSRAKNRTIRGAVIAEKRFHHFYVLAL